MFGKRLKPSSPLRSLCLEQVFMSILDSSIQIYVPKRPRMYEKTFCQLHQILNCCLQTLSDWKSLKFVVWERVNTYSQKQCSGLIIRQFSGQAIDSISNYEMNERKLPNHAKSTHSIKTIAFYPGHLPPIFQIWVIKPI